MYFLIEDEELLKKWNSIWKKVSNSMKKNLIANRSTIKNFWKPKKKSYDDQAIDFHYKEIPKVGPNYSCLAVILIDFVLEKDENYYPQIFLKECKYIKKEKMVIRYISNDLKVFSDDSDQIFLNKDV